MILPFATPKFCACCGEDVPEVTGIKLPGFTAFPLECPHCEAITVLCKQEEHETLLVVRPPEGSDEKELREQFPRTISGQVQTLLDATAINNPLLQYYVAQLIANAVPLIQADGQLVSHEAAEQAFLDTYGTELDADALSEYDINTYLACPLTGSYLFAKQNPQGGYDRAESVITVDFLESDNVLLVATHLLNWSIRECDYFSELRKHHPES